MVLSATTHVVVLLTATDLLTVGSCDLAIGRSWPAVDGMAKRNTVWLPMWLHSHAGSTRYVCTLQILHLQTDEAVKL